MLNVICNFIGYTIGTSVEGDCFMYGIAALSVVLIIFYFFDTIHDLVNMICPKKK